MKNLLLAAACVLLPCWLYAQNLVKEDSLPPVDERLAWIYEHLDLSEAGTGLLYGYGLRLIDPTTFRGDSTAGDTADLEKYARMYATIYGSKVDSTLTLSDPADLYMDAYTGFTKGDTIPLLAMISPYNSFHPGALDSGWISLSGEQFYDVLPRSSSPYLTDTVFVFTPLFQVAMQGETIFRFDTTHTWRHPAMSITGWSADFGAGFVSLTQGGIYDLPLASGDHVFRFRVTLTGGRVLECKARFTVRPEILPTYPSTPDINFTVTGAGVNGFSACGDGTVRKPLIWIEGFNPQPGPDLGELVEKQKLNLFNNLTFEDIRQKLQAFNLQSSNVWTLFEANDYDLFYIDFADGAGDMYDNAEAVRLAIQEINSRKALTGSTHRNIVIGESMGGVLGKIALREMELAEEDHQAASLISFDSPFQGANIPLAYQDAIYTFAFARVGVLGPSLAALIPELRDMIYLLEKPASKQLLIHHWNEAFQASHGIPFRSYVAGLGPLEQAEHIALANGAIDGTQLFNPGTELFYLNTSLIDAILVLNNISVTSFGRAYLKVLSWLLQTGASVRMEQYTLPVKSGTPAMVSRIRVHAFVFGIPVLVKDHRLKVKNLLPVDGAPGGIVGSVMSEDLVDALGSLGGRILNPSQFCFMPTYSALDLRYPENEDLALDLSDIEEVLEDEVTLVSRYGGSTEAIPVHTGFADQKNQYHAVFYANNVAILMRDLVISRLSAGVPQGTFWGVYNYGANQEELGEGNTNAVTPSVIKNNITINSPGELYVGADERIADMGITRPVHTQPVFTVTVQAGCSSDVAITVNSGGALYVGDPNADSQRAHLLFSEDTGLLINDGGVVEVRDASSIEVGNDASVTIAEGGMLNTSWSGQLKIKDGGTVTVGSGGILRVSQYSSVFVEDGASLHLEDGAIVQLWDGDDPDGLARIVVEGTLVVDGDIDFSGNGFFDFYPGHTLTLTGSGFSLAGHDKAYRMIRLAEGAQIDIGSKNLTLEAGKVVFETGSRIAMGTGSNLTLEDAWIASDGASIGIESVDHRRVRVRYTDFTDFTEAIVIDGTNGAFPVGHTVFLGCHFTDNVVGIVLDNLDQAYIYDCSFEGSSRDRGIEFLKIDQLVCKGSSFEGLEAGVWALNSTALSRLVFSDCYFYQNEYGVMVNDYRTRVNVVAREGTIFQENDYGIYIEEGNLDATKGDHGLVLLDCARLINNGTGVRGKDLLIQIDAYQNSHTDNPTYLRSNVFDCNLGTQHLFDLCYDVRSYADFGPVPARGNYWDFTLPFSGTRPWRVRDLSVPTSICFGGSGGTVLDAFTMTGYVGVMPSSCPSYPVTMVNDAAACVYVPGGLGSPIDIRQRYYNAMAGWRSQLDGDEYDTTAAWYDTFGQLAQMSDSIVATLGQNCQQYIRVARTFHPKSGSVLVRPELPGDGVHDAAVVRELSVFPNPFSGTVQVSGVRERTVWYVLDMLGRTVALGEIHARDATLDLAHLLPGHYVIRLAESYAGLTKTILMEKK